MVKQKTKEIKEPNVIMGEELTQIYSTGAFGGFTPYDFRIYLFNETLKATGNNIENSELVRVANYELIMTPQVVKELRNWLNQKIDEYEAAFQTKI